MSMQRALQIGMAGLLLGCAALAGCRIERATSREERREAKQAASGAQGNANAPMRPLRDASRDDATPVVEACGRAGSDRTLAIYNHVQNGPVRRMVYVSPLPNHPRITLDFVPSVARAQSAGRATPYSTDERARPGLPAGSVWRFDEARLNEEEFLSSGRLGVFLPCAAQALSRDY